MRIARRTGPSPEGKLLEGLIPGRPTGFPVVRNPLPRPVPSLEDQEPIGLAAHRHSPNLFPQLDINE
jgi:hypothetical protein